MKVGGAAKGMLDVIHQFFPLLEFFLAFFCDKGYVLPFSMDREGNEGQDQVAGTVDTDIQLKTLRRSLEVFNMKINMRRDYVIFQIENHIISNAKRRCFPI